MKIEIPVITIHQFRERVIQACLHETENAEKDAIFSMLLTDGFPTFDKNNLDAFLRKLQDLFFISFETVAVNFDEPNIVWLVSGMNAILVTTNTLKTIDK